MAENTRTLPLSAEQEKWYGQACERLNPERLRNLLLELINIHSPTGAERRASEFAAAYMREHVGEHSRYQPIGEETGNAIGEIRGSGGGAIRISKPTRNATFPGSAPPCAPICCPRVSRRAIWFMASAPPIPRGWSRA